AVFESTDLPRKTVLREFSQFAARFFQPAVAKLDPQLIHKAANDLDVAKEYAVRMLCERNLPEHHPARLVDEEGLAEHLVKHYPAHEFLISRSEAKMLGLPVESAELYDKWPVCRLLHDDFRSGKLSKGHGWIRVFSESDLADIIDGYDDDSDDTNEIEEGNEDHPSAEDDAPPGEGEQVPS
ncbi:MAG TPA: hypothetical protein VJ783_12170, partial [Pirellulales bacterium]|nr:hypothetical protein [Pirellulales bacterium]